MPVMPLWPVKLSVSPAMKPPIVTVAPVSVSLLSTSASFKGPPSVDTPSSGTGEPPPMKVTVTPACTVGATCTVSRVLVPIATSLPLLPSLTVQLMVRVVSPPLGVGSPLAGEKL